jgi:hypothetical protein
MEEGGFDGGEAGIEEQDACTFQPGDVVVIHGLVTAVQHNGRMGRVLAFEAKNGRYAIWTGPSADSSTSTQLLVKPSNLMTPPPANNTLPAMYPCGNCGKEFSSKRNAARCKCGKGPGSGGVRAGSGGVRAGSGGVRAGSGGVRAGAGSGGVRAGAGSGGRQDDAGRKLNSPEDEAKELRDLKAFQAQLDRCSTMEVCACCGGEFGSHEMESRTYSSDDPIFDPMRSPGTRLWFTITRRVMQEDGSWDALTAKELKELKDVGNQGHAGVQCNLGCMYAEGKGVPRSEPESVQWWQKAADNGHVLAQLNLGVWLFAVVAESFPRILPKALAASHKYLVLAAKQGNETAKQAIKGTRDPLRDEAIWKNGSAACVHLSLAIIRLLMTQLPEPYTKLLGTPCVVTENGEMVNKSFISWKRANSMTPRTRRS